LIPLLSLSELGSNDSMLCSLGTSTVTIFWPPNFVPSPLGNVPAAKPFFSVLRSVIWMSLIDTSLDEGIRFASAAYDDLAFSFEAFRYVYDLLLCSFNIA